MTRQEVDRAINLANTVKDYVTNGKGNRHELYGTSFIVRLAREGIDFYYPENGNEVVFMNGQIEPAMQKLLDRKEDILKLR